MVVKKRVLIIYNPRSGRHKVEQTLDSIITHLKDLDYKYTKYNIQNDLPENPLTFIVLVQVTRVRVFQRAITLLKLNGQHLFCELHHQFFQA